MDIAKLCLSAMRSLWGIITPNVREASVNEKGRAICLYFYYDTIPTEAEIDLSEDAITEVVADFPEPLLKIYTNLFMTA